MKQRILRNQVDASPGGGAVPQQAAATPTAQPAPAQGAAPAATPAIDPAMAQAIAAAIAPAIAKQVHDSVFADARRAGLVGAKPRGQAPASGGEGSGAAAAPTAPAAPDLARLRQLDRAIATSGRQLNESAYNRIERAFAEEQPENATEWLKDYFDGFGGSSAPAAPAQQQTTTSAPQGAPATARGSQPAPTVPLEDKPVLQMTEDERNRFIKAKGVRAYTEKLAAEKKQLGRVPTK